MRVITGTYLANFQFSQIEWVKSRSIMKVNGKCPLILIRIKVFLSVLLQSLTKMVLNYILCITSVYPHKTFLLAYTDIWCPYSISAFESLSNSAFSDNHVSWFFTGLAEDIIWCHMAQKRWTKMLGIHTPLQSLWAEFSPVSLTNSLDMIWKKQQQQQKTQTNKNPKPNQNIKKTKTGWTWRLCFNSRLRHPNLSIHNMGV